MAAKNIIIKKKIGNDIYELLPKTQDTQIAISTWGSSTVETLASISARIFDTVESWEAFKASVDFAGSDSALDTLRELIDTLNDDTVTNGIANQLKALREQLGTTNSNVTSVTNRVSTIESDLNTADTGLKAKVSTIESDLNTADTGLKAKVSALDETVNDEDDGLVPRVTALESASNSLAHVVYIDSGSSIPSSVTSSDIILQEV